MKELTLSGLGEMWTWNILSVQPSYEAINTRMREEKADANLGIAVANI